MDRSLILLALVTAFYSLSSTATGIFLPNYYLQIGLGIHQIIILIASMLLVLGLIPILTLKFLPQIFEKLLILGILLNAVFYVLLATVKEPLILGIVYGLSLATYWPAFNLLLFRLTDIKKRGLIVSLLYVTVPAFASIIGPFLGGSFIHFLGFHSLFIFGIVLLSLASAFSLKIRYAPTTRKFNIPKSHLLLLFAVIILISGFTETSWIAYPLFLHNLTGGFFAMGILASLLSAIFAIISLIAGRISQVEKHRISFAFLGMLMTSIWLISLASVHNVFQLLGISIFSGLSSAFGFSLLSLYGDFFKREQHATLVALWETFLMCGRLANLIPVSLFITSYNFKEYFSFVGLASLLSIIPFSVLMWLHSKGKINVDAAQK
ncbi:MAG TPA: MFS transporter [Candidatus Acidoferrum sp.]|nr:MFS transporter [Candidatus Acidoferrum sp.]